MGVDAKREQDGTAPGGDAAAETDRFDLGALVRTVAAEHADIADPALVADYVFAEIPASVYPELVARLLPRYVGDALRREQPSTDAVDADGAWDLLLSDRVPTAQGYRFLSECDAETIRAGALRRRVFAERLTARADLYEQVADEVAGHGVTTPAKLDPEVGRLVFVHRGYQPARVAAGSPLGRSTVAEVAAELATVPDDVLATQLLGDTELLEKAVLADARGVADPATSAVLRSPELAAARWEALRRMADTLQAAARYRRIANGGVPTLASRRMLEDVAALVSQQPEARVAVEPRRTPTRSAPERKEATARLREWAATHPDRWEDAWRRHAQAAGLPEQSPHQPPAREDAWWWLYGVGHVEPAPVERDLLGLTDERFAVVVRDDASGKAPQPGLRLDAVLNRWGEHLRRAMAEHDAAAGAVTDEMVRARRGRYRQALMQRAGECRRLVTARHHRAIAVCEELNRVPERNMAAQRAWEELAQEFPDDLADPVATRFAP